MCVTTQAPSEVTVARGRAVRSPTAAGSGATVSALSLPFRIISLEMKHDGFCPLITRAHARARRIGAPGGGRAMVASR